MIVCDKRVSLGRHGSKKDVEEMTPAAQQPKLANENDHNPSDDGSDIVCSSKRTGGIFVTVYGYSVANTYYKST